MLPITPQVDASREQWAAVGGAWSPEYFAGEEAATAEAAAAAAAASAAAGSD
jgi:hypothetical protein